MIKKTIRILVVEDSPSDAGLLKEELKQNGKRVFDLSFQDNLKGALDILEKESFDAILLDLTLPGSTGMETFNRVKTKAGFTPIIILTGSDNDMLAELVMRAGAQDYIVKGNYSGELLARSIMYSIERSRQESGALEDLRRMAAVVSDSNDAVILHDLDGKILAWNRGAKETYGYTETEALEMNVRDIVAEPDREAALTLIQKVKLGEIIKSFELRRIAKDGRILDVWLTTTLLADKKGKPVAIATTERDITERNKAEAALKDKLEDFSRLATVVSDSNDAIILHDLEGKILAWNRGAIETYGYTETKALGMNVRDIVAEPDREAALTLIDKIKHGEIVKSFELRRVTKDGRILNVWLTTTLLTDEKGKPVAIATTERDITERNKAEIALKEKLEDMSRLATVVSDSNDAVILHDFEGKILAWNRGAIETYGYSEAEALEKNVRDIVAESDREAALTLIEKIKQGEIVKSFELRRVTKDERILNVWLTTTLLTDEKGKPVAIATTERDITERNKAEIALKEKLEDMRRLATVISDSNDAVILHDFEGKILAWNRGAIETYGYTESEALEKNVRDIVAESDREAALTLIDKIKQGEIVKSFELRRVTKDGRILDVWLTTTLLTDEKGKPVAIATTERDITERKQAEAELLARQAAEAANAAKSEFLSRMSHELRTPMNSILGFAQLLEMSQKEPLTPTQHERVQQILKGGQMLLEIINEVLDLSRIEAGRMTISPEPVNIQPVLEEALGLVNPLAEERHIRINMVNVPSRQFVQADRQRLKQVLLNLLGNAIKYNREGGLVTVSCKSPAMGWLRVSVHDTGMGIPASKLKLLFQPFERIGMKEGKIEGTGLGLALSKRLVELMGGSIGVESVVDKGSTFWFDLPLTESPIALVAKEGEKTQPLTRISVMRTLLYIEDNLANFELVKQVLSEQPQIELLWAMQGGIGLHLAEERHPDLILLDLHLPDMHGADVLQILKQTKATRDVPVLVLSADATPGQIERLMNAGAHSYLTKPLDVKEFLLAVEKLLKKN